MEGRSDEKSSDTDQWASSVQATSPEEVAPGGSMPVLVRQTESENRNSSAIAVSIVQPVPSTSSTQPADSSSISRKRHGEPSEHCVAGKRQIADCNREMERSNARRSIDQFTQTEPGCEVITVSMSTNGEKQFSHVVVYLTPDDSPNGSPGKAKGEYKLFSMDDVSLGAKLTDWNLESDTYKNRWRTWVKPVKVRVDGNFVEASLFLRIRPQSPMPVVREVIRTLNMHLNMYKDHVREGIAEEWNAQEQWRIFPARPDLPVVINFTKDDRPDVRNLMKELLPQGYDNDWSM